MSSKKAGASGGYGRSPQRGPPRDTNRRHDLSSPSRPAARSTLDRNTGEPRALQLLRRVLLDEDDPAYSRRSASATQLLRLLGDSRQHEPESSPNRQERNQLMDICLHGINNGPDVLTVFETIKAPKALKQSVVQILSSLACSTRLDMILGWLFDYLGQWKEDYAPSVETSREREVKMWLLRTLQQIILDIGSDSYNRLQFEELSSSVVANLITFLDAMDSADYLPDVLDALIVFSKNCGEKFTARFQDVIDLLVGWNIDPALPEPKRLLLKGKSKQCLELPFAFELLYHFLNDMRGYVTEITSTKQDPKEIQKKCDMFYSLFSCFYSILQTVILLIPTEDGHQNEMAVGQPFDQLRLRTLELLMATKEIPPYNQWTDMTNQAILTLISVRQTSFRTFQGGIYQYFTAQLPEKSGKELPVEPIKYVEMLIKMVHAFGSDMEESVILDLLETDSPLYRFRSQYREDKQLNSGVLVLLRTLIRLCKNPSSQANITKSMVNYLKNLTSVIYANCDEDKPAAKLQRTTKYILDNQAFIKDLIEPSDLSTRTPLTCSQKVTSVADSLFIGYLLLDTAVNWPEFKRENIIPVIHMLSMAWEYRCTDVFDALLKIFKGFWTSCGFGLVSHREFGPLELLLQDLTDQWAHVNLGSKQLICGFVKDMLSATTQKDIESEIKSTVRDIILGFIKALDSERNSLVMEAMVYLVIQYCQVFGSAGIMDEALTYVQKGVFNASPGVQKASRDLLTILNPFATSDAKVQPNRVSEILQNVIMATPHTGSFRPAHYEIVMKHLGMTSLLIGASVDEAQELAAQENSSLEWARKLFYHCDTLGNMKNIPAFIELQQEIGRVSIINHINNSGSLLFYWAMWESARYCILSRLRTPFGGPQQTFAAFERTLNALVADPTNLKERQVILNERERTMQDKVAADPVGWFNETNHYLRDLVEACIQNSSVDIINGLQSWYKKLIRKAGHIHPPINDQWSFDCLVGPVPKGNSTPSTTTNWVQVASLFASGKDEAAIKLLQVLRKQVNNDHIILKMLDIKLVDFYTCLEDYESIRYLSPSNVHIFGEKASKELEAFTYGQPQRVKNSDSLDFAVYFKVAPLGACLQLARLNQFRQWLSITEEPGWNNQISSILSQRIAYSLRENIFSDQTSLLELQLQQTSWKVLYDNAEDWRTYAKYHVPYQRHRASDTKYWARLATYFTKVVNQCPKEITEKANRCLVDVLLNAARVSRKQANITTANHWIEKCLEIDSNSKTTLYERTKILLAQSNVPEAIKTLRLICGNSSTEDVPQLLESKAYLMVAKLLKNASEENAAKLLGDYDPQSIASNALELQSPVELAIETAFEKSTAVASCCDGPWFEYATHNYKQGWRILDEISRDNSSMSVAIWAHQKLNNVLVSKDNQVSDASGHETIKSLLGLLQKYSGAVGNRSLKKDPSFVRAVQQTVPFVDDNSRYEILETLDTLQNTILQKFRTSVNAYFRFLSLGKYLEKEHELDEENSEYTSMIMTTTLRLLRMLVKYGDALQPNYTENVEAVRIEPWKQIIPQLFARLSHPAESVRQVLSKLISRICDEYPSEIIYDVIVSSTSSKTNRDTKQALDAIATRMIKNNDVLWNSTRRMAEELEKITVLWEEKWLNRIASLQFDVMQQFQKLDQEVTRLKQSELPESQREKSFHERYDSVMKFVIQSIDKMLTTTINGTITTPHEQWFENTFGKQLRQAFQLLQKPGATTNYRKGWDCFQQLHRQLMMETQKVRILELSQISPYLASMKDTIVGIPGVHDGDSNSCIESFGSTVIVLPTKTKPKKLDLKGADGKKYSYLFKGLEDLHLDERIMQLLNTTNGLLKEDRSSADRHLKARTYAVIPLSDHSGMIQWVNDATPMFALYKRWQKREHTTQMIMTNEKLDESVAQALLRRPTENFMDKVAAALKEEDLRVTANRRHWPKHILKKAYMKLAKETPENLLSKELWCTSSSSTEWLAKSVSFSRSLAVMSIIGYIIGLGDRHLDNIMVDYQSAEVIHIDYNVCFEKGMRLRVPELVPYRLSQNLYNALGITGADGVFRAAAEETLRVLRKHKEVFITLLDAFVYDPLVDWESEAEEMQERQMLEIQANLGLIAARLSEKKSRYENQQSKVARALSGLSENIQQSHQVIISEKKRLTAEYASQDLSRAMKVQTKVKGAKEHIITLLTNLRVWHEKHKSAIDATPYLDSLFAKKYITANTVKLSVDKQPNDYKEFFGKLSVWAKQRDVVYRQCFEDIRTYRRLLQPLARNVFDQDCCGTYAVLLTELIQQDYKEAKAQEVVQTLQQNICSEALQKMGRRASVFSDEVKNFISKVNVTIEKSQDELVKREKNVHDDQKKLHTNSSSQYCMVEVLSDSLYGFEDNIRKFNAERLEISNDDEIESGTIELAGKVKTLEEECYFGCFTQTYPVSQTSLFIQLREHMDLLCAFLGDEIDSVEIDTLEALSSCAIGLYQLEEGCLSICNTVFEYIQTAPHCIDELILQLKCQVETPGDSVVIDVVVVNQENNADPKMLLDTMQEPFINIDEFCRVATRLTKEYGMPSGEIEEAVERYIQMKNTASTLALLNIMQEAVEQYRTITLGTWVSPLILSWNMTRNSTIAQSVKSLLYSFASSVITPVSTILLMCLRDKLNGAANPHSSKSNQGSRGNAEDHLRILQEKCTVTAEIAILDMAKASKEKYESYLRRYDLDTARFQWFNAPYIMEQRPLPYSKLVAKMAKTSDELYKVGTDLESLKDEFVQLSASLQNVPEWRPIATGWKTAYDEETKNNSTLTNCYSCIIHFESSRLGFEHSMVITRDITEALKPLTGTDTENDVIKKHEVPPEMLPVPLDLISRVEERLKEISEALAELRSPTDGIVPLLESVLIVETEADNELKPAQQSAKATLDELSNIEKQMIALSEQKNEPSWTFAQLNHTLENINKAFHELFSSLRTLEGFGTDTKSSAVVEYPTKRTESEPMSSDERGGQLSKTLEGSDTTSQNASVSQRSLYGDQTNPSLSTSQVIMKTDKQTVSGSNPDNPALVQDDTGAKSAKTVPQINSPDPQLGAPMLTQRRNVHVLGIMRRIRAKLDGKDFGVQHKMSVSEQVARTIDQATSIDNLCLMYEVAKTSRGTVSRQMIRGLYVIDLQQ
ncbi:hypothetical protein CLU79DRAFT_837480 [Phycomyces nitens]|nr:hypothetical protein CLU79DRAFT_837480 [Phycomyces nitens]